jgi:hypothetical protein
MMVGNGKSTSFWHKIWSLVSLADKFPEYMKLKNWRLSFRRWLHEDLQCQYRRLHDIVFWYGTNSEKDRAK